MLEAMFTGGRGANIWFYVYLTSVEWPGTRFLSTFGGAATYALYSYLFFSAAASSFASFSLARFSSSSFFFCYFSSFSSETRGSNVIGAGGAGFLAFFLPAIIYLSSSLYYYLKLPPLSFLF